MFDVIVSKRTQESERIISLELTAPNGGELPEFSAGAHIDVVTPNGPVRQYSLCNSPAERHRYCIAVQLEADSRGGSTAIHQAAVEGSTLQINAPRNLFPLDSNAQHSLLVAGGIGVTPIRSMAASLHGEGKSFELHYCGRQLANMAYLNDLQQSEYGDQVHIHCDESESAQRLDITTLLQQTDPTTHIYVCGPAGFMDYILDGAAQAGWPAQQLHREYFSASSPSDDDEQGNRAFDLLLSSSNQVIRVAADTSAAGALLAAGIDVPLSCEQGICGSCLTTVLEGIPEHRDSFLTPDEQAANNCFTPCCSRAHSRQLTIDL